MSPTLTKKNSILAPLFLVKHKENFEKILKKSIPLLGEKTKLRDACEYALLNGGKRFRPLIVMLVAEAIGKNLDVHDAALSVEYFHTASLIADDLPCMDNDDFRRSIASTHKKFGETIALLASYGLITAAFEKISSNTQNSQAVATALECAARCSGIKGATGGQYLDLFPLGSSMDEIHDVIYKKTVTLFEVSFVFGWVFGGGDFSKLDLVKKTALHFGRAFQIADDLADLAQDSKMKEGMNIALCLGEKKARQAFKEEMEELAKTLVEVNLASPSILKLCELLKNLAST